MDSDQEQEQHSLTVTVPSKVEDESGFPQSREDINANLRKNKKGRVLSPKKTVRLINMYTFRLYNCFKLQIVCIRVNNVNFICTLRITINNNNNNNTYFRLYF